MQIEQPERALLCAVPEIGCNHQDGNEAGEKKEQVALKDLGKIAKGTGQNRSHRGKQNACHARQFAAFGIEMGSARGDEGRGGAGNDVALVIPAAAHGNEIHIGAEQNGKRCRNGKARKNRRDIGKQFFKPRCQSHGQSFQKRLFRAAHQSVIWRRNCVTSSVPPRSIRDK